MNITQALALAILGLEYLIQLDKQKNPYGSFNIYEFKAAIAVLRRFKGVEKSQKRLLAQKLLTESPHLSFSEIGRQVGLSHTSVRRVWLNLQKKSEQNLKP